MSNNSSFEQNCIYFVLENCLNSLELIKTLSKHVKLDEIYRLKLDQFHSVMKQVIPAAMEEILLSSKSNSLELFNTQADEERNGLNHAKSEENELTSQLKELRKNASIIVANKCSELSGLNMKVGCLKDAYQDQLWMDEIKLKYVCDWMDVQVGQLKIRHENQQAALKLKIAELQTAQQQEYQVHDELENYYSSKLGELIQALVDWVDKFERDKNDIDAKIAELQRNLAKVRDDIEKARTMYQSRRDEIEAFEILKEKRRLEQLHMEHLNKMATRIQAWWKGLMVRLKLGQYKAKKKKRQAKCKKR